MSTKGAFIVIEGSDGSGKATQTELLAARLHKAGYAVETVSFPRYDEPSSHFVREYLAGNYGPTAQVNPYTASLFYALDRYQAAASIREALAQGKIVIANRYIGSNMAHQGAKFAHPDERRGFFIWLDSVEFQTMGIPRPDKSLVLHVPADVSTKLIDKRGAPKDDHEQDTESLAKTVQVFTELCDLFPNDFIRLDCMRGNRLMNEDAVHAMIWGTVEPLLPTAAELAVIPKTSAPLLHTAAKPTVSAKGAKKSAPVETSVLLAAKLGQGPTIPAAPTLYIPSTLDDKLRKHYQETLREILDLRQSIAKAISKHIQSAPKRRASELAKDILSVTDLVVPFAAMTTIELPKTNNEAVGLPEVQELGLQADSQATQSFAELATHYLPDNHAPVIAEPRLISYWPRNELELLPEMLYEYANVPIETIRANVDTWPMQRKQDALASYVQAAADKSLLNNYRYVWDILANYQTVQSLTAMGAQITSQAYTPRYGYDTPSIVDDAEVSDKFERCFDLSLHLYNILHSAGLDQEAQYAVLLGHKQRYSVTLTASHPIVKTEDPVIAAIAEKLLEVHPLLHESKALKTLEANS